MWADPLIFDKSVRKCQRSVKCLHLPGKCLDLLLIAH